MEFIVTDLTKNIDGVDTRVVWERDFADGTLEEAELAFFAEDDGGTVWNFGEYPEEFADGAFDGAPSTWITGLAGAHRGIHMLADPDVGGRPYVEGRAPRIDFFDVSRVAAKGERTCTPLRCFTHVLTIDETSPREPDSGVQTKHYAPRVGLVRVGAVGGEAQERLRLTSLSLLDAAARRVVDRAVLNMDRHGHLVSKVYRQTDPIR